MKKNVVFIVLCLCFWVTPASAEVLQGRVGKWAPLYFVQDGKWTGMNVDAYQALGKEANITITLKEIPWSRGMNYMKYKPMLIAQLSPTEERKKNMNFIGPHAHEEMRLLIHKRYADRLIRNLDDLVTLIQETGKKIAYQQDTFYSREFNERIKLDYKFKNNFQKKASLVTLTKMVKMNRILGFFEDKNYWVYKMKTTSKESLVVLHPFVVGSADVYFGVSKVVSQETLKKLQEANKRLLINGTYNRISKKWDTLLQRGR